MPSISLLLGMSREDFFFMSLNNLICYSNLVLHLKAYHVLTWSSRPSQQANLAGTCHGKDSGITNYRIVQEPFPFRSLRNHSPSVWNTLLCTERLLWEALNTRGVQGYPIGLLTRCHKLRVNHDCFNPHLPIPGRACLHNSYSLQHLSAFLAFHQTALSSGRLTVLQQTLLSNEWP